MDSRSNAVPAILTDDTELPVLAVVHSDPSEYAQSPIEDGAVDMQRLTSTGVLASRVIHEFNNLLTAILGNAALGKMDAPEGTPTQRCFTNIERSGQRASELCQQLALYNRGEESNEELTDLNGVIQQIAGLLRLVAGKRSALEINLASDLPAINLNVTRIHQVLIALVLNAVESLPGGRGTTCISTGRLHLDELQAAATSASDELTPGEYVFLAVTDNGSGISSETRARLFEPFHSAKGPGRGLGLAASLKVVREHQGALKIESAPGQGTCVKVFLPCGTL